MTNLKPETEARRAAIDMVMNNFTSLMEAAMAADIARMEQRAVVVAEKRAEVSAQPVPAKMIVRMDGYLRRGRQRTFAYMYVTGVSFADGDGYRIKKVSYTSDHAKAMVFSSACGLAIAKQLAGSYQNILMLEAK